jgi:hypothetical protein
MRGGRQRARDDRHRTGRRSHRRTATASGHQCGVVHGGAARCERRCGGSIREGASRGAVARRWPAHGRHRHGSCRAVSAIWTSGLRGRGVLFAAAFDRRAPTAVTGVPLIEGVGATTSGGAHVSVSETGSLLHVPGPSLVASSQRDLALLDLKSSSSRIVRGTAASSGRGPMVRARPNGSQGTTQVRLTCLNRGRPTVNICSTTR